MESRAQGVLIFVVAALSYLMGSIPFGVLLTRASGAGDLRAIGSGSIGATNVLRTGRRGLALATLLLDGGKGAAAYLLAARVAPGTEPFAGLWAMLGHLYPVWLGFRGGKGVASGFGVLLAADWRVGIAALLVWAAAAAITRISSVGGLSAFAAAPVVAGVLDGVEGAILPFVLGALVWWRHRGNIGRLRAGTEPRIGAK